MIIETNDIHGNARIINPNFITNIECTTRLPIRSGPPAHPCNGVPGDQLIRLYMSTGQVIEISCDPDGADATEGVLRSYKNVMSAANV